MSRKSFYPRVGGRDTKKEILGMFPPEGLSEGCEAGAMQEFFFRRL